MGVVVGVWDGSVFVGVGLAMRGGTRGADATFADGPSERMSIGVA